MSRLREAAKLLYIELLVREAAAFLAVSKLCRENAICILEKTDEIMIDHFRRKK